MLPCSSLVISLRLSAPLFEIRSTRPAVAQGTRLYVYDTPESAEQRLLAARNNQQREVG